MACRSSPWCPALPAHCWMSWGGFNSGHWADFSSGLQCKYMEAPQQCSLPWPSMSGVRLIEDFRAASAPQSLRSCWECTAGHSSSKWGWAFYLLFSGCGQYIDIVWAILLIPQGFFRAAGASCCHSRGPLLCPILAYGKLLWLLLGAIWRERRGNDCWKVVGWGMMGTFLS